MFATVNRDEDTEPAPYPEAVPRPGDGATEVPEQETPPTVEQGASAAEIVAFLSSPR
ncbi:hypothetical protein [Streptomyces pseudovenezuelae]|uniref:Uncharacterized protein n=1 Tax=Streptomyces pseudovenezuelae TaxID=67350 RepID=A0ABT6LKG9_9ACTN|nr:hypothetical protein [Streptomyces pseudovenezuelae]